MFEPVAARDGEGAQRSGAPARETTRQPLLRVGQLIARFAE